MAIRLLSFDVVHVMNRREADFVGYIQKGGVHPCTPRKALDHATHMVTIRFNRAMMQRVWMRSHEVGSTIDV